MKAKRILLVVPPFYRLIKEGYALCRYPLSLGYLASAVEKATDWEVMVYNADFSPTADLFEVTHLAGKGFLNYRRNLNDPSIPIWRQIRECIAACDPAVLGISAMASTFASAGVVARIAKEINPEMVVVAGGPHPSSVGRELLLSCRNIDFAVVGEGERTLPELLRVLENGSYSELAHVRGVVFRREGQAVWTGKSPPVTDLDSLGFPSLSASRVLIGHERYPAEAFRSVLATRGCPNHCFYCGSRNVWGRTVRFRSPRSVAQEIQSLQKRGLRRIHFEDDTFGVYPSYLKALCDEIADRCPEVTWSCETHVKLISEENVSVMKKAGCTLIQLGIESGSNRILREVRKGFTIDEAWRACELIRDYGIDLETFFMTGFPQETEESLRATLKAIETVECQKVIYSIFTPYPGTEAFEWCRTRGLIADDHDPSLCYHQSPVNRFCAQMDSDLFRSIASEIEQTVDQKNRSARGEKKKEAANGSKHQAHTRLHP